MKTQEQVIYEMLKRVSTPYEALAVWIFCGIILFAAAHYNQR